MSTEAPHPTVTAAILERQAQHRSEKLEAAADAVGKVAGALHRLSDAVGADDAELANNFRDQVRLFGGRAADALAPLVDTELVAQLRRAAESGAATAAPSFPPTSALSGEAPGAWAANPDAVASVVDVTLASRELCPRCGKNCNTWRLHQEKLRSRETTSGRDEAKVQVDAERPEGAVTDVGVVVGVELDRGRVPILDGLLHFGDELLDRKVGELAEGAGADGERSHADSSSTDRSAAGATAAVSGRIVGDPADTSSSSVGGEGSTTSASVAPPLSPSNSGEVGRIVAAHVAASPTNPGEVDHPLHGSASASPAEIARIVTARRRDSGATS